jgi:stearoyl-CoA desaturase (delta-9 desaturase)
MFGKFRDQSRYLFRWMLLWALALGALTALYGMPSRFYLSVGVVAFTGFALMLLGWYLLLGPTWFAAVWMPVLLSGWWLYAVVNYYTHPPGDDGRNHAVDLCTRPWHRLVNRVGFGILYHGAHHRNAQLFNPGRDPLPG